LPAEPVNKMKKEKMDTSPTTQQENNKITTEQPPL
jgi:hypothetical protein